VVDNEVFDIVDDFIDEKSMNEYFFEKNYDIFKEVNYFIRFFVVVATMNALL